MKNCRCQGRNIVISESLNIGYCIESESKVQFFLFHFGTLDLAHWGSKSVVLEL